MKLFCTNCGKELQEGQDICLNCGVAVKKDVPANKGTTDGKCKSAITGFVLGLVSILAWFLPLFGYPVTICGIVFSVKGIKSDKKAMAIIGLVLSIIFLIVTLFNSILGVLLNLAILD